MAAKKTITATGLLKTITAPGLLKTVLLLFVAKEKSGKNERLGGSQ
jgi:hypothetical protein